MSRIGKKPVAITDGAKVSINGRDITVEKGSERLSFTHRPEIAVRVEDDSVVVEQTNESRFANAMHGTTRTLIANMIEGVTKGYQKQLEVVGVGWTAKLQGNKVNLNVGYADTRVVEVPAGVNVAIQGQVITITGADKQKVGQTAAKIRSHRKPEPYNGKGIKYVGEQILRKQGKAFGSG